MPPATRDVCPAAAHRGNPSKGDGRITTSLKGADSDSRSRPTTRVRVGAVEQGLAVVGRAADEIVHLLAELLDNATAYSSPDKEVRTTGHLASGHAVIEVVDEGVGLSPCRLPRSLRHRGCV